MTVKSCIVTPTWNNEDYTIRCFDSIQKNTKDYKIIWVDNGSEKESREKVKNFLNEENVPYELIQNEENLGFVKATNQGMRRAMDLSAKYIILQNNDTEVYDGWLDRMIEVAESDEKIGLVGPITSPCASWQSIDNLKKMPEFLDLPEYENDPEKYYYLIRDKFKGKIFEPKEYLAFFSTLIKNQVIGEIGFLSKEFGVGFGDDVDYSIRAKKNGWKLVVAKDVFVFHNHRTTFKSIYSEEKIVNMLENNTRMFQEKHKDFYESGLKDDNLDTISELKNKLVETENLLRQKEVELDLVKSSKFWKLREYYEKIKFLFFHPVRFFIKYYKKAKGLFFIENPKVLVVVNHYYGESDGFNGKSSTQKIDVRKKIVERVLGELKKIPNADINVCGIKGKSLIDIDIDFSHISNPSFLIYESIQWMVSKVDEYDYFINIEDDILLTPETFNSVVRFDKVNPINECFHPNRIEYDEKKQGYCVDFKAWPGWKDVSKKYMGYEIRVANNPHSGLTILSKDKVKYALKTVDFRRREKIIGHYMASAYANVHEPFLLFRSYDDVLRHKVVHLDNFDNWIRQ